MNVESIAIKPNWNGAIMKIITEKIKPICPYCEEKLGKIRSELIRFF